MAVPAEHGPFPQRLYHSVPPWVNAGSFFHIRIRAAQDNPRPLTEPKVAQALLDSVQHYHVGQRWQCLVFLLMPDHSHALLAFPMGTAMSHVIGDWKRYAATKLGLIWQVNYFDHRIRDDHGLTEKHAYILKNPVVKGLCSHESEWPWVWRPNGAV
jgi:putative transposase